MKNYYSKIREYRLRNNHTQGYISIQKEISVKKYSNIEKGINDLKGQQPISNRFDGQFICPFLYIFWCVKWLKKPIYYFDFYNTDTISKVLSINQT